ncbi:hypothetical protein F5Y14DRAFT_403176 [Nemania sp. NC0429]|nr:hypothetical protein F5Y14DRAFT_403176 [Nemania sp. NC0429]
MAMTTAVISTNTAPYPPLTTVFTPPTECTKYQITCYDLCATCDTFPACRGSAFPQSVCRQGARGPGALVGCYPDSTTLTWGSRVDDVSVYGVTTYLPGVACPLGMTTATSLAQLDAVFCCPTGLTFSGDLTRHTCETTMTEATFTYPQSECALPPSVYSFGPNLSGMYTIYNLTLSQTQSFAVGANAILLWRQGLGSAVTPDASSNSANPLSESTSSQLTFQVIPTSGSNPAQGGGEQGLSKRAIIATAVSLSVAVVLILALAFFLIKRHRRKRAALLGSDHGSASRERFSAYSGKPELQGSAPMHTAKAELDAAAIRAELLGSLGEDRGAGMYVLKPELEGTPGEPGTVGRVYVKKKSELEARNKASQIVETEVAELADTSRGI